MARFGRRVSLVSVLKKSAREFDKQAKRNARASDRYQKLQSKLSALQEQQARLSDITVRIDDESGKLQFTDKHGGELSRKELGIAWDQNKQKLQSLIQAYIDAQNHLRETILTVHHDMPDAFDAFVRYTPEPFNGKPPVLTIPNAPKAPAPVKPLSLNFLDKLFPFLRAKKELKHAEACGAFASAQADYEKKHVDWKVSCGQLKKLYTDAQDAFKHAEELHDESERNKALQIDAAIAADDASRIQALEAAFGAVEWPRDTTLDYELVADGVELHLDVDLPEIEDFPSRMAEMADTGKQVKFRKLAEKQLREDYATHVHGVFVRLLGIAFAALPCLNTIIMSGYSQRKNKKNAIVSDEYLLSVSVTRDRWGQLALRDASIVDPTRTIEMLNHIRKMNANNQFSPIEPYVI